MARTPKATLVAIEDAGPPPEPAWDKMSAEEQRAAFVQKVMAQRAEEEKQAEASRPRPVLTERQRAQIEAEMAQGAKVSARHAAQQAVRPTPAPDKSEGYNTPVFRPEDFVPSMDQGKTASASVRTKNL